MHLLLIVGTVLTIHNADCKVTRSWEDGAAIAHCENHKVYALDPDTSQWHRTAKPEHHYGKAS